MTFDEVLPSLCSSKLIRRDLWREGKFIAFPSKTECIAHSVSYDGVHLHLVLDKQWTGYFTPTREDLLATDWSLA